MNPIAKIITTYEVQAFDCLPAKVRGVISRHPEKLSAFQILRDWTVLVQQTKSLVRAEEIIISRLTSSLDRAI